jgi:hypothetical protein
MARKTLLSEGEVRQFMKLADLTPIGHGRLEEFGLGINEELPVEDEEAVDMEMGGEEEAALDAEEAPVDDMEVELDPEADAEAEAGAGMVSVDDFMAALETALEDVTGQPVSTEIDDDLGAEDEEAGLEDDAMAMEPMDDMDAPMGLDAEAPEEELPPGNRVYENQEEVVNEVARRVAARLGQAQKKNAMVDQLAERILKRLTK